MRHVKFHITTCMHVDPNTHRCIVNISPGSCFPGSSRYSRSLYEVEQGQIPGATIRDLIPEDTPREIVDSIQMFLRKELGILDLIPPEIAPVVKITRKLY